MGKYFTTSSISIVLPGFLKSDTTTSDSVGTAIFERAIENTEGYVNSVISRRYDVTAFTTTSIPPLLRKITEDLSIYEVLKKTGYRANERNEFLDDFKDSKNILEQIAKGEVELTYTDGSTVAINSNEVSKLKSSTEDYNATTNLDDETNWEVDGDQLEDIEDERDS